MVRRRYTKEVEVEVHMARKTVRVDIPMSKPDDLIVLGKAICSQHSAQGDKSPLDAGKMTALLALMANADATNSNAKSLDAQAQTARQSRDQSLGIADGQTAYSPNTALNIITYARDQLLVSLEGDEESLGNYGFNVVVGSAKTPQRTTKAQFAK